VTADSDAVREHAEALAAMRNVGWRGRVPRRFRDATLDSIADPLYTDLLAWVTHDFPRPNLILTGPPGVGKTHAAVAAARARWDLGDDVRFRAVAALMEGLRPDGPDSLDVLVGVDVLVLDDLGAEKPTDWTRERLDLLIDARWAATLPTIITTNLRPDGLEQVLGPRVWSRVAEQSATAYVVSGADRRRDRP